MMSKGYYIFNSVLVVCVAFILGAATLTLLPIGDDTKKSLGYPADSLLNFTELTARYGYLSEQHTVVTEDGYILTIFRIAQGRNCKRKKKNQPVLLVHGLLQSSDSWIDSGPNSGLAYLIADACHDIWVGNVRGNYYARRHVKYDPDKDVAFWQFSVDEIGFYDIPAMIDYVLDSTGAEKLNYIGFSQGAGAYLIMCSERPNYCDKANILIGLAPAARQTHTYSKIYRIAANILMTMEGVLSKSGVQEVFAKGALGQEFLAFFCQLSSITVDICATGKDIFDSLNSLHPGSINNITTKVLFGHFPAGTSLHNIAKYGQSMNSARYQKFDYGKAKNLDIYGTEIPPKFNLSAVTVPVVAIYGENDALVDIKDIDWLLKRLPNVVEAHVVKDPLWNHLDMSYSQYVSEMIFPKINHYLNINNSV
ncbi:hypothetical protein K1T71_012796 [Dendrolimus kikuchii]|uniref:Uncharacterized protein n=1 Tax=Dendrolimus kikuchii TaxID=765133 RepID=A0ACC1CID1_9NEOP|nr:hypothetical protein K1T71_012796 [Dendrolimus kikuchii]